MSASARSERERRKSLRFMIKNPLQQVGGGKLLSFAKRILGAHKAHRQEEEIRCQRLEVRCPMKSRSQEDRKSTRLNSSHSQISYAVFCLKKKKKKERKQTTSHQKDVIES